MKLKDWLAFNKPFMNCDFKVKLLRNRSFKQEDILIETVVKWDTCERFLGDYTIAKFKIDRYIKLDSPCF